jgi:hypothetical protein
VQLGSGPEAARFSGAGRERDVRRTLAVGTAAGVAVLIFFMWRGDGDGAVYAPFRNSALDEGTRLHVATFAAAGGEGYNRENCSVPAKVLRSQEGAKTRFLCEKGRLSNSHVWRYASNLKPVTYHLPRRRPSRYRFVGYLGAAVACGAVLIVSRSAPYWACTVVRSASAAAERTPVLPALFHYPGTAAGGLAIVVRASDRSERR